VNVNTLNCNNNVADSVVTPPQMNNILLWYDSLNYELGGLGSNIAKLYDRAGNNTMAQTTINEQPSNVVLPGKFGNRRVTYFDSYEDRYGSGDNSQLTGTVNLQDCFGPAGQLNDDPPWTIAYVGAIAHGTDTASIFTLSSSSSSALIAVKEDGGGSGDGLSLRVTPDTASSDVDQCGGDFIAADVPRVTVIKSVHNSGNTELSAKSNDSALDWDDEGGPTNTVAFGTFSNINTLKLGVILGSTDWVLSYLAEFIFFNAALSDAEITQVTSYLNDKWQVY